MGYPWHTGETLLAADLNAAIANSAHIERITNVANVLDYGADPTGVAESGCAINAAAAELAPNGRRKSVYIPAGTYHIRCQIELSAGQTLFGDGRGNTVLTVSDDFDPAATAVILCTSGGLDPGPILRDFSITFAQPFDQGSRANFKTLAAGGTSHAGGTGVQYPWAIATGSDSFRIKVLRVRIGGAWNGISTNNHNAIIQIEDLEIGALNVGISYGRGTAVLDQSHVTAVHFWPFDLGNTTQALWNVFNDGQTTTLLFGNASQLDVLGLEIFCGRVIFNDDTGRGDGACHIVNCMLDGDPSSIEVVGQISHLHISNIYGTAGTSRVRPFISVTATALVKINNWYSHSGSSFPDLLINSGGADVTVTNFNVNWFTVGSNWLTLNAGICRLSTGRFNLSAPRTVPLIAETGAGVLVIDNVQVQSTPIGTGPLLSMVTASPLTIIGRIAGEAGAAWTNTLPGGLYVANYSPQSLFHGSIFADGSLQAGTPGASTTNIAIVGAAGAGVKTLLYYRGGNRAFDVTVSGAGDDFTIGRWNDAGSFVGNSFAINRATGGVSLLPLQSSPSYANDAAAAAGGVPVTGLYRNGSVVQIRVV